MQSPLVASQRGWLGKGTFAGPHLWKALDATSDYYTLLGCKQTVDSTYTRTASAASLGTCKKKGPAWFYSAMWNHTTSKVCLSNPTLLNKFNRADRWLAARYMYAPVKPLKRFMYRYTLVHNPRFEHLHHSHEEMISHLACTNVCKNHFFFLLPSSRSECQVSPW